MKASWDCASGDAADDGKTTSNDDIRLEPAGVRE